MKSLADLKSSPDVGLAEETVTVCVSAVLARELKEADEALFEALAALESARNEADAQAEGKAPPRRAGADGPVTKAQKVADAAAKRSDEVRERAKEASVELVLRAKRSGTWRQWVAAHPAREEGEDRHDFDMRWAAGFCNLDALIDALPEFVVSYNGEPASDEWAEFLAANGVHADLRNAACRIVAMHEQGFDLGKSRAAWLADQRNVAPSK